MKSTKFQKGKKKEKTKDFLNTVKLRIPRNYKMTKNWRSQSWRDGFPVVKDRHCVPAEAPSSQPPGGSNSSVRGQMSAFLWPPYIPGVHMYAAKHSYTEK